MKINNFYFLFVFVIFCSLLNSVIWDVKQDGTGDFPTIQEGINASTNSDTVLVYPGTYFENINYNAKNITVSSLYLTTQDEQYINQTIIDGNQNGSCVRIISGEDSTTVLCGFTIINGSGSSFYTGGPICGGGILIKDSQPYIEKCLIMNNNASAGGGISCMNSQITLAGVSIINNYSYKSGGGIFMDYNSEINFDEEMLCDIYLNYAAGGCEIAKTSDCPPLEVFVDTFTVFEPDGYFISSVTPIGVPLNDVTLYCQNAKLESVNADLYVSTDGDNDNSGLSTLEPLATINYALSLVKSDTLHPNIIHIADGTYSKSLNDQCFPLNMRAYVSLNGESMENTILDAEGLCYLISDGYSKKNYSIKNMILAGGYGNSFPSACIKITAGQQQGKFVYLENISISEFSYSIGRLLEIFNLDLYIKNLTSRSNYHTLLRTLNLHQPEQEVIIENAYIHNNSQYSPQSGSHCQMEFGQLATDIMNVNIINMEMTENQYYSSSGSETCSGIEVMDNVNLNLINCTIGNNSSPNNGGVIRIGPGGQNSVINIYNSILYGDSPGEIYIDNEFSSNPSTVNIQNSLVNGGFEGIENVYSWNVVNWMEGNLDTDPYWDVDGDNPYALWGNSPCINAGTLDLPAGVELPEYDLAGYSRIYGETIDMGAYEYQGVEAEEDEILPITQTKISNYPNPFNPSTTIKLDLAESGKIELAIYNIKGQKVKTLIDAHSSKGHFEMVWKGLDDNKKKVASGNYFIKLKLNEEEKAVSKCILLK